MTPSEEINDFERLKLVAEAQKAQIELKKIKLEYREQLKVSRKKWYNKESFWRNFVSIFLGFTILGFYINYIIIPSSQIQNIELSLENTKHKEELNEKGKRLKIDSINLYLLKKRNDSLSVVLYSKQIINDSLQSGFKIAYSNLNKMNKGNTINTVQKANQAVTKVLRSLNLTDSLKPQENIAKKRIKIEVLFSNGFGSCTLRILNNGLEVATYSIQGSRSEELLLPSGLYAISIAGNSTGNTTLQIFVDNQTAKNNVVKQYESMNFFDYLQIKVK